MPIITRDGLVPDGLPASGDLAEVTAGVTARVTVLAVDNATELAALVPHFDQLQAIIVDFPNISDGRGFSLGKALRNAGFRGTLRARGEMTPDQFPMALLCGFDEVEISGARLARQPIGEWQDTKQVHLWRERLNPT